MLADDIGVAEYPARMVDRAIAYNGKHPGEPPRAYLLAFEADCVDLPAAAPPAEHLRVREMMASGTLGQHPAARVQASAWCVDVTGRGWSATRFQGDPPGAVTETFYEGGTVPADPELAGLLTVAYSTGMVKYGLPGPPDPYPGRRR